MTKPLASECSQEAQDLAGTRTGLARTPDLQRLVDLAHQLKTTLREMVTNPTVIEALRKRLLDEIKGDAKPAFGPVILRIAAYQQGEMAGAGAAPQSILNIHQLTVLTDQQLRDWHEKGTVPQLPDGTVIDIQVDKKEVPQ